MILVVNKDDITFLFLLQFIVSCTNSNSLSITGETMGTTYTIKIHSNQSTYAYNLRHGIDSILTEVNNKMSTYITDSEIMKFNYLNVGESINASDELIMILRKSYDITDITDHAFDISVGPLVELWGFGLSDNEPLVPDENIIKEYIQNLYVIPFEIINGNKLIKIRESRIDLSAIAKGYAVDELSNYLISLDLYNHMVDIGGDVYCSGKNKSNIPWSIGIQYPQQDVHSTVIDLILLSNKAVATSGNYRNRVVIDGIAYTHIINPKTGYPIDNNIVSATVITDSCIIADAYATALMVMGREKGKSFIEDKINTEAIIFYKDEGSIKSLQTSGFNDYEN